jgi:mannosyltransferase OCH1-like enzyme
MGGTLIQDCIKLYLSVACKKFLFFKIHNEGFGYYILSFITIIIFFGWFWVGARGIDARKWKQPEVLQVETHQDTRVS